MSDGLFDRLIVGALERWCWQLWGFKPAVIHAVVRDKGPLRATLFFAANMPRVLKTMRVLGPVRTHLAASTISLYNSCTYCAFGQTYALELVHLRESGRLLPMDSRSLDEWLNLTPKELSARLQKMLRDAGLQSE